MTATRTTQLTAGFALALGLLGALAWFATDRFGRMQETASWVARTHEAQRRLSGILSLVQDVELGARGFLLTGQPAFLEPFEAALSRRKAEFDDLCALIVSDSPAQQVNCDRLAPLIEQRVRLAEHQVDLRRTVGFGAARASVASGAGKALTDAIRAVIAEMDDEEARLLARRTAAAQQAARVTGLVLAGGTGLAFTLLITTFALVIRENRLRQQSQALVDRFFTLSLDMLGVAGMDGYFKRLSPAFTDTLGYTLDELMARPFLDFVHPDDRAATVAEVERLAGGRATVEFENRYRHRDGSWRCLSWRAQPVVTEGLLYASARDVTDKKEAEARVAQLNNALQVRAVQLAEANSELESFSYSVSHDLRAPLRSIDGFSQILLEDHADQLPDDGRDALHRVRAAAKGMGELIDALLALSRLSRVDLRAQRVDLSAMAAAIAAELRRSQPERQAEFIIQPDLVAEGDQALLEAALRNLIGNAWKYSQPRALARIEVGALAPSAGSDTVYFVRDNGVGFDMAYVGKLFGAFQRLHRPTEFPGTGVGLATVQRIMHRHGGRAWAEGQVGLGATFYFTLPGPATADVTASGHAGAPPAISRV